MTEFELYSLSYEAIQIVQGEETTFFTLLFGYLIAAYFLGDKVSKSQLTMFTGMYLATISGLIFNMWIGWSDIHKWNVSAETSIKPEEVVVGADPQVVTAMVIYTTLVVASLYFMWSVRHPKAE